MTTDINDREDGRWRFANASFHARSKYVTAHPNSALGDPNYADTIGYQFVSYTPQGLLVYCRKDSEGDHLFFKFVGLCVLFAVTLAMILFPPDFMNRYYIGAALLSAAITLLCFIDIVMTLKNRRKLTCQKR